MVETEVKIPFKAGPQQARDLIERAGYAVCEPRTLESDQLFDQSNSGLKNADQLLRLRRSGAHSTVTYKGPATRERHKSREEIEFDVSDPAAFELVLNRLGYMPGFRYEKYRTKFAAPPGIITNAPPSPNNRPSSLPCPNNPNAASKSNKPSPNSPKTSAKFSSSKSGPTSPSPKSDKP